VGTDESRHAPKGYLRDTGTVKQSDKFNGAMGKPERKALVLAFLDNTRLAFPPRVLYRNLRLVENATFSENSLGNYLDELIDEGLVQHVDPAALADRRVVDADPDDRGYYLITRAGAEEVNDNQGDELASELLRR
jgi:hypothetical protein